jgi:tRNA C32,U32 (ribose-2'-O)-methylase TrmJ
MLNTYRENYMRINWYNVRVQHQGSESNVSERIHKMGRYAKRKDVEPLLRDMEKTLKEHKTQSKVMQTEVQELRHHFSAEGDEKNVHKCTDILNRLKNIT